MTIKNTPLDQPIHASTVSSLVTQISGESQGIRAEILDGLKTMICLDCGSPQGPGNRCSCTRDD